MMEELPDSGLPKRRYKTNACVCGSSILILFDSRSIMSASASSHIPLPVRKSHTPLQTAPPIASNVHHTAKDLPKRMYELAI